MDDRAAFLAKHARQVTRDPLYGCWIWSPTDRDGYGVSYSGGRGPRQAHRETYVALLGPVPEGKVLDHECRNRACCRPEHLNPITGQQNDLLRKWSTRCRKTTCRNGHSLSTCITTSFGGRLCRTCQGPEADVFKQPHPIEAEKSERWANPIAPTPPEHSPRFTDEDWEIK